MNGGIWLTDQELELLSSARSAALHGSAGLREDARAAGTRLYPRKPKHHLFDETCRRVLRTRLNPGFHWCFADEDFLKSIKRVAMRVHVSTASRRTLQRYLVGIFGDSL